MALSTTSNNQQVVNARILAEMAVQFNIGADILGKGNRHVEKYLGAEKMSGDTVMVPIVGNGEVYDDLDLSDKDLSVSRDAVPVTVKPLTTAATVDQETLTLSIKNPEIMAKRVANMAMQANVKAYKTLEANAINTKVISSADVKSAGAGYDGRSKIYDTLALCEGSKLAGETYGVVHPLAWSKLVAMFQGNYAPNDSKGNELYKNELGELGGIRWTKGQHLELITGRTLTSTVLTLNYSSVFAQDGYDVQAPAAVPSYAGPVGTGTAFTGAAKDLFGDDAEVGDLSLPFTLAGVYSTDIFGNSTGQLATFRLRKTGATSAELAAPAFFEGPRKNVTSKDYNETTHVWTQSAESKVAGAILQNGVEYLPPAVVWKRDDFLVAVKGLEKFYGCDSLTIPTSYREKGILPLRGLCWTDPVKASTIFRVDVLMGMAAFTRTSINSLYIQAN